MARQIEKITDDSMHKAFGYDTGRSKVDVFKWNKDIGIKGEFLWIPKEELNLDISYQREIDSAQRVKDIASKFQWALFGVLIVSYNDGGYFVIDGGHRLRGAFRRDDIKELPCIVFCFNDPAEEARIFYYFNNKRKNVSAFDNHKAALRGEGKWHESKIAIKAENMVKKYGYIFHGTGRSDFQTAAIRIITKAVERNEIVAENAFSFLAKVAGGIPIGANEFNGLFYLMQVNPQIDFNDFPLRNAIEFGYQNIKDQIKRHEMALNLGGYKTAAKAIAQIANKGQIKIKLNVPE